jgi:cytoskeletal protein RodZ
MRFSSSILSASSVFFTVGGGSISGIPFATAAAADNNGGGISRRPASSLPSSSMLRVGAEQRTTTNYNNYDLQHNRMLQPAKTNNNEREKIGRPIGSLARDPTLVYSSSASMSIDAILSGTNGNVEENNNTTGGGKKTTTKKIITYVASAIGAIIALVLLIGLGLCIVRRCRNNTTRKHKQNPLAAQNSNDALDTSDDDNDDNNNEQERRRKNEYEESVEVSDSSYDGRRYSSHTDDTSTITTIPHSNNSTNKIHVTTTTTTSTSTSTSTSTPTPTKGSVVPPTVDNYKTNNKKEEQEAETQDSSWFGWVLGSTGKIEEDKPSGNNVTYGEI